MQTYILIHDTNTSLLRSKYLCSAGTMNWMVRMTAELEVSMNSVERVVEYEPLDTEAAAIISDNRPPSHWPSRGVISLSNLEVRYRPELPPVIEGLSFSTRAQEKVRRGFISWKTSTNWLLLWYRVDLLVIFGLQCHGVTNVFYSIHICISLILTIIFNADGTSEINLCKKNLWAVHLYDWFS